MLPIPNPFIPEEHEPWCPLSNPSKFKKEEIPFSNLRVDVFDSLFSVTLVSFVLKKDNTVEKFSIFCGCNNFSPSSINCLFSALIF